MDLKPFMRQARYAASHSYEHISKQNNITFMFLFRMLKGDKSLNRHLKGASALSALHKPSHQPRYGHLTILMITRTVKLL